MAEKEFEVNEENLSSFQEYIENWCEENSISMKLSTKFSICVDEIASNVVFYSGATYLKICCELEENMISISFIDNGKEFNPLEDAKEPDITAKLEDREIGGLGIFMVKKFMDSITYERKNNENILKLGIVNE